MGDVVGDLEPKSRGMMKGMDDKNGAKVLKADVPLSEMFGYVTQLRTMYIGTSNFSMEFSHYLKHQEMLLKM
jgi:elongation factor G